MTLPLPDTNTPARLNRKANRYAITTRRTCPERFTMAAPVPFADLVERIRPHETLGLSSRVLSSQGQRARWSGTTVRSALSDLTTGLVHAAMATLPADERSVARARHALEHGAFATDVRSLLEAVPDTVAALRTTADSRRNTRARVTRLLRAFVSGMTDRSPVQIRAAALSPPWQAVIDALHDHAPRVDGSIVNGIMHLAQAADAAGMAPAQLPMDPSESATLLRALIRVDATRYAVRSALGRLARLSVPGIPVWPVPTAQRAARRLSGTPAEHLALADAAVPALAALVRRFTALRLANKLAMRPATAVGIEAALHRMITFAVGATKAGLVPTSLAQTRRVWDWWTTPLPLSLDDVPTHVAPGVHDHLFGGAVMTSADGMPAVVAVQVWAARCGLMPKATGTALPRSVLVDAHAVWRAAQHVATAHAVGKRWGPDVEALMAQAQAAHAGAVTLLEAHLGPELTVKDKRAALQMATLPMVLGLYLPYWTLVELPRRLAHLEAVQQRLATVNAASRAATRWAPGEHPEEQSARHALDDGLETWFVLAVIVADPLRIKNLWAGRLGIARGEYRVHAEFTDAGALRRLRRISSHFGGDRWAVSQGHDLASLKTSAFGERHWDWAAVAVCPAWTQQYLERVWLPRLRQHGLITADTSLHAALQTGHYPLFVADPAAQRALRTPAPMPGGYATDHALRRRFRGAMLTVLRAIDARGLGLVDEAIPADDEAAAQRWPWLLAPHIARLWWASHMLGVLELGGTSLQRTDDTGSKVLIDPVHFAQRATTDRPKTLRESYDAASDYLRQLCLRTVRDWRHPLSMQDEVVNLLCAPDTRLNWAALWDTWARETQAGAREMLPPALLRAWSLRRDGADIRVPALRRKGGNRPTPPRRLSVRGVPVGESAEEEMP